MTARLPSDLERRLRATSSRWLVTGVAGFIGSNLLEALLRAGQDVVGIDDYSTGFERNLDEVRESVGAAAWSRFRFVSGDIRDEVVAREGCAGVDYVLHQAALGSVPRSIDQPLASFDANVDGFMRVIDAARHAGVKRFVYASSSSVYGDSAKLPKVETEVGRPLSPYAATKVANELFAEVYARTYAMQCVGLRYFNVFGPRQDPDGAYAAVIPRWFAAQLHGEPVVVNGDGKTSRDFCYVANAVQANLRSALSARMPESGSLVINVAVGAQVSLLDAAAAIDRAIDACGDTAQGKRKRSEIVFRDFRAGDVRHSLGDISLATEMIGYRPTHSFEEGLAELAGWYRVRSRGERGRRP